MPYVCRHRYLKTRSSACETNALVDCACHRETLLSTARATVAITECVSTLFCVLGMRQYIFSFCHFYLVFWVLWVSPQRDLEIILLVQLNNLSRLTDQNCFFYFLFSPSSSFGCLIIQTFIILNLLSISSPSGSVISEWYWVFNPTVIVYFTSLHFCLFEYNLFRSPFFCSSFSVLLTWDKVCSISALLNIEESGIPSN